MKVSEELTYITSDLPSKTIPNCTNITIEKVKLERRSLSVFMNMKKLQIILFIKTKLKAFPR